MFKLASNRTLSMLCAVGLAFLVGCSQPGPEERLTEIGQDVENMEDRLASLTAEISRQSDALHALEIERRKVKSKLMTLEERLQRKATDVAIFRATQVNLLNEPMLRNDAISVSVDDGIATLKGTVSSPAHKQKAKEIAEAVPGVAATVLRIQVDADTAANRSS